MENNKDLKEVFYEKGYAGARHNFTETSSKYLKISKYFKDCNTFLDIGCADGGFLDFLKNNFQVPNLYGVNISSEAVSLTINKGYRATRLDLDKQNLPFESNTFDGVFCGEVIEHLYDPDHLLDEIYRVLKKDGIAVLTTPNLASWFNRVFLLFGYQPLFTEVSLNHGVGDPFPFWLKSGHLRIFTLKALKELVLLHNFKIISIAGFGVNTQLGYGKRWKSIAGTANRLFSRPSFSSDLLIEIKK